MERYFPLVSDAVPIEGIPLRSATQVPDRWMKQQDAPEEEGNSLLELWPDW